MKPLVLAGTCAMLASSANLSYPPAPKGNVTDSYNGVTVADPYRWLEDTNSPQTKAWVEAENKLTFSFLAKIPQRNAIGKRLTQLFNYERYPATALEEYAGAFERGGKFFYFRNDGLQNQDVLYVADSPTGVGRVLIDPNTLRADGTAALSSLSVSNDGNRVAYAIAQAGSDWSEWHIRETASGKDLPDLIQWTKFTTAAWTAAGDGFFYQRFPQPDPTKQLTSANEFGKLYFHKIGDPQASDRLIYERKDHPIWQFGGSQVTDDGRYLVITIETGDGSKNLMAYAELNNQPPRVVELVSDLRALYNFAGSQGKIFYLLTTDGAPKGRIVAVDLASPARSSWKTVVPEQADSLSGAQLVSGRLVLSYLKDAHSYERVADLNGKFVHDISLPSLGTVSWSPARQSDKQMIYSFTSYTTPPVIYRYDIAANRSTVIHSSKLSFDPNQFETEQVFYNSKDGTRVPMFLVHRKGIKRDGSNPTLLYAYGGFNISMTPRFSPGFLGWVDLGGVLAVANLRGGAEYGEAWHLAGTKLHKQNVFDDFISAAEWLISNKITSTPKLAIHGGSNGGLLIGAVLNQRPELFGAALPAVGVMDMLRFNKFTVGASWEGDYGSPENPSEFAAIRAYSPLHNIKPGTHYPPTLITTSDHDDRVVPGHSFKYAAALQAAQGGPAPILIRIETRAGHGAGKPTTKIIEEAADRCAFLVDELHVKMTY